MKQCLIITAYKSVEMLRCLLKATHDHFYCYVHVDKEKWKNFEILKKEFDDVSFLHDYVVKWGGQEHLIVILKMLDMSLREDYNYVHIISGEDYPTKPVDEIIAAFDDDDRIYCDYNFVSGKKHHAYRRYCFYWPYTKFSMNYKKPLVRYFNLFCVGMQKCFPILQRNHIGKFQKIYWGFIWGTYPRYAIEYVLNYLKSHREFWKDLSTCIIPEELCFQTILMNSDYKEKVVNNNLRYWNFEGGDGSGPIYLGMEDYSKIEKSNAIFARKIMYDSELREHLERKVT